MVSPLYMATSGLHVRPAPPAGGHGVSMAPLMSDTLAKSTQPLVQPPQGGGAMTVYDPTASGLTAFTQQLQDLAVQADKEVGHYMQQHPLIYGLTYTVGLLVAAFILYTIWRTRILSK